VGRRLFGLAAAVFNGLVTVGVLSRRQVRGLVQRLKGVVPLLFHGCVLGVRGLRCSIGSGRKVTPTLVVVTLH
jgi:hypothetical protein